MFTIENYFFIIDVSVFVSGMLLIFTKLTLPDLQVKAVSTKGEPLMPDTNFHMSKTTYLSCCISGFFILLIIAIMLYSKTIAYIAFAFLAVSYPGEKIGKFKLPFYYAVRFIRRLEAEKRDKELYQSMSILKNMCIMQKEKAVSAGAMIEQIALMSKMTKTAYLKMLSPLRLNKKEEAKEVFIKEARTDMAIQVADILIALDELHPAELASTIEVLLTHIEQEQITKTKERDEEYSYIVFVPVFANTLLLFMNFLLLTFFQEQKESLNMFFNF